jgi:signal transduction histidine kinase
MLFVFGSVALLGFWDRVDPHSTPTRSVLTAMAVASTAAFVQWGPSGMETTMFCFFGVAVVFVYLRLLARPTLANAVLLGLVGCGLAMTRPNGVVLLGVVFVHGLVHRRTLTPRILVVIVVAFAISYGSYFGWRWSYYGHFLPNTFYAKVGSSSAQLNRGVRYVVAAMPAFALIVGPIVASWGRAPRDADPLNRGCLLLALCVTHIAYVVAVGGDNFPAHRFLVVVVPFLWLLAIRALPVLAPTAGRQALLAAVVIGYNFVAHAFDPETRSRVARDYVATEGQLVGRWLAINTPPDAVIATNSAGALAYFSRRQIIDTLGLNDETIAHTPMATMGHGKAGHEKGNGFYVLSRQPDYVFFGGPRGAGEPMFTGDKELFELRGFQHRYVYERANLTKDKALHYFRRLSDEELQERADKKAKKEAEAKKKKEAAAKKKARAEKKRKAKARAKEREKQRKAAAREAKEATESTP